MKIARTKDELWQAIEDLRGNGKKIADDATGKIALVPTMGALHDGHLSLIDTARQNADIVIASIFVNPAQFGEGEDFEKYPRNEGDDLNKLEEMAVEIAYIPAVEEIYPDGFCTGISVTGYNDILCGAFRPGHFDGVATVVCKLLMHAMPDIAVFGEKDYQQLHIIRRMVADLDLPIEIVGAPVMREDDGLAMSSRNVYLNREEREIAPEIYRMMCMVRDKKPSDSSNIEDIYRWGREYLLEKGFNEVDYVEIRYADTLEMVENIDSLKDTQRPAHILTAARLGNTRLIDNIKIY